MNYEVIRFQNNNLELEVNVSPEEETVWLSKEQLSQLFNRDRSVISRHIKNIFTEKEVEEKSNVHFLHIAGSDKPVPFYSLDIIISVGYRVKSQNGIVFRKWANSVLKEYLLRGYALNEGRTLVTKDNYLNLVNRVDSLDKRVNTIEIAEKHRFVEDVLLFDNQMFDAIVLFTRMIETAHSSVVLIDPYIDAVSLSFFKNKNKDLDLIIVTSSRANIGRREIASFIDRYGNLEIKIDDKCHDRYLIIDNELFYHLGCSINYLGKRLSQITLIKDKFIIDALKKRIDSLLGNKN